MEVLVKLRCGSPRVSAAFFPLQWGLVAGIAFIRIDVYSELSDCKPPICTVTVLHQEFAVWGVHCWVAT